MHVGRATVGGQQAGGHGQRRGFTGTVGADDPVERSGGDVEGEVGDSDEVSVDLDEASDRQGNIVADGAAGSVSDTTGSFTRDMPVDFTAVP